MAQSAHWTARGVPSLPLSLDPNPVPWFQPQAPSGLREANEAGEALQEAGAPRPNTHPSPILIEAQGRQGRGTLTTPHNDSTAHSNCPQHPAVVPMLPFGGILLLGHTLFSTQVSVCPHVVSGGWGTLKHPKEGGGGAPKKGLFLPTFWVKHLEAVFLIGILGQGFNRSISVLHYFKCWQHSASWTGQSSMVAVKQRAIRYSCMTQTG